MEVEVLDPFDAQDVEAPGLPAVDDSGAYAGLVGMICEHRSQIHAIDFQNPKRRVEPPKFSQRTLVYGGIAAAVALLFVGGFLWRLTSLNSEIAALRADIKDLTQLEEKAREVIARTDEIQAWADDDYVWLDELRVVSERMPPAEKALVREWGSTVDNEGRATIKMELVVDQAETISMAEYRLRDEQRAVGAGIAAPDDNLPGYAYRTSATISLADPVPPGQDGVPDAAADGSEPPPSARPVVIADGEPSEGDLEEVTLDPEIGGSPTELIEGDANDPVDAVEEMLGDGEAGESNGAAPDENSPSPAEPDADSSPAASPPAAGSFGNSNAPASTPASAGASR
jgi:hypothetical protein